MYPHIITDNTITVIASQVHTISKASSEDTFNKVCDLIRKATSPEDWDVVIAEMTPRVALQHYVGSNLEIHGSQILYKGEPVNNAIVPHILKMREGGYSVDPLMRFLERLLANPSMRSRNQLWRFVETNNIPIDEEGNLLLYKRVKDDYYDCHTGSTNCYTVGSVHTMDRAKVDDDPESTCSFGLHVCSYNYLRSFGGSRTIICKVDPADVVSVPIDYENTKLRVCKLYVHQEIDTPTPIDTGVY